MRMNTGAISYVNMLVLAVAVNHSPAKETMSNPMSVMVPLIIIKIIMEMADSAKIIISLAQAPRQ